MKKNMQVFHIKRICSCLAVIAAATYLTSASMFAAAATDESEGIQTIALGEDLTEQGEESDTELNAKNASDSETDMETNSALETDMENTSNPDTESETEKEACVVVIDPGHQGSWVDVSGTEPIGPGSTEMKAKSTVGTEGRYSGVAEYELNLEISLLLRTELEERGYEVILTREDNDTAISNVERATLAYEQGGDIFVRIHANGSENASADGALGMVPSPDNPYVGELSEDSYLLADCILSAYCEKAEFDSRGVQYYDNMTGINWSQIPVMILEMGFMTNESDDLRMTDETVQPLMAEGIADGIDEYFAQKEPM
ncbi:MAG: N-acetylmuramoyl-L-alanine amidase [Lachnospiraceae bacterium]|nr:N-acetylmuramoyl-L-alanine amidase [Lachnospiraceae bacterium]